MSDLTHCSFSTGIDGSITAGRGKLSDNGYWEFPCQPCADRANVNRHNAEQISKLSAELSTLQAALEQATKERDAIQKRCDLYAREVDEWQAREAAVCPEDCSFERKIAYEHGRAEKAEAALAQVQKERDRDRSQLTTFADGLLLAELTATRAALAQVQRERAWQPIETAPKDGRDILLHGSNWTRTGYWARRVERWSVDAAVQLSEPTHWAHLPLRPTTPEREEP